MAEWISPKIDYWNTPRPVGGEDFKRIEGNTQYLKEQTDELQGEVVKRARIITGQYTGNGHPIRHINVGFAPKYVKIKCLTILPDDNTTREIEGEMFANGLCYITSKLFRTPVEDTVFFEVRKIEPSTNRITQNGFDVGSLFNNVLNLNNWDYSWVAFG